MNKFFDISKLGGTYAELITQVQAGQKVSAFGMGVSERVLTSCALGGKALYLTADYVTAGRVAQLFSDVLGEQAALYPAATDSLVYHHAQSQEMNMKRLSVLSALLSGKIKVLVASVDSLFGLCPTPLQIKENCLVVQSKMQCAPALLRKRLVQMGYVQQDLVSAPGQFALRGDVLDVFVCGQPQAHRIEFFDVEVESIHAFDPAAPRKKTQQNELQILPYKNLFLNEEERKALIQALEEQQKNCENENFKARLAQMEFMVEQNDLGFSADFVMPLVRSSLTNLLEYFEPTDTVVIDECKMVYDSLLTHQKELETRLQGLKAQKEWFVGAGAPFVTAPELLQKIPAFHNLGFLKISSSNRLFETQSALSFKTAPVVRYAHNMDELARSVQSWVDCGIKVFLCAKDENGAKQIQKSLANREVFLDIQPHALLSDSSSAIVPVLFSSGFMLPERLVVLGTWDLFPKKSQSTKLKSRENVFTVPKVGDYVVHEVHGIGVCEGVTKLSGQFGTKDYVVVRYRGEDKLYVPIDQMDMLSRFSGADTPKRLSKIGGAEFSGIKEKVRQSIRSMAFDLLKLYAERESKRGFAFPQDDVLQLEFENSFPYTETEDQLKSLDEIKKDMQSNKVMERLLCGDVGFGKTEVALRAAFKAVLASKQVAFLAPTTILSEQHFQTASQRFGQFGVRLAVLNRFRSPKEQKSILKDLENGKIDILFGTHRVLSKDVVFHDLGLIILDEEQKFGVEDKEKLKLLKKNVDVLTLSATPIPRTLHMSLSGIRDVSVISTPPSDRLPIQTYVCEQTDGVIQDAIQRELSRGGQVFYVYNRVESIYLQVEKIKKLCPSARVVVGHGQMPASELESVIYQFSKDEADVLVCTTIIENGIDISNANTLIVQDAQRFGLSQLYQIRGRVGRSNRLAYAYFLYPPQKVLTEEAYQRLEAISEFTEFGSGFQLAMRDLEIRGSGNVLGAEQHGHLQKVGYDLYAKMLAEEVAKMKGEEQKEQREVTMKIALDAFIPESYISDSQSRMTAYKRIAQIRSEEDKEKMEKELEELFSRPPQPTRNLIEIAYVKSLARSLDMVEVVCGPNEIKFVFNESSAILRSEQIANAVYQYRDRASLDLGKTPAIRLKTDGLNANECFLLTKDFLKWAKNGKK